MRLSDRLTIETKQAIHAWIFLAVPIVFFVVIRFYPAIESFGIAFTEWNLLSPAALRRAWPTSGACWTTRSSGSRSRTPFFT